VLQWEIRPASTFCEILDSEWAGKEGFLKIKVGYFFIDYEVLLNVLIN
jgi:hypothetical protein